MWSSLIVATLIGATRLELSSVGTDDALASFVWEQSPELQEARTRIAQAQAEARRAQRLPNPSLDLSVNTLPIGASNPVDLTDPLLNVPNVQVGLSVLLEIGKRGPRQQAADEAARAAALEALDALRLKVIELEDVIGDIAAAQVRVDLLEHLYDDARSLSALQRARADKGDTSGLDADRARLEEESTVALLDEAKQSLAASLRDCTGIIACPCVAFDAPAHASSWLTSQAKPPSVDVAGRADLRALEATLKSARAAETLAARGWVPDPTVRVGYVRDQFVISGNQQNSLFFGVSFPLRLFEHGQDDAAAASVAARSAERQRDQLLSAARVQLERMATELDDVQARQTRLRDQSLPLARSVVERLSAAIGRGAAPLQELLLARRALADLVLRGTELDRTLYHLHVARTRLSGSLSALPSP